MGEAQSPEGWVATKLGCYLYLKNGFAFKSSSYVKPSAKTFPVIRISDLDGACASDKKAVHVAKGIAGFELRNSDLLIAMSGATTGKMGVYTGTVPAFQNQRVGCVKLRNSDNGSERYKLYLVSSLRNQILKIAYGGAQPNISGKAIEEIQINLPPLAEQKAIAQKLDTLLAQVETTKARLDRIPDILKHFRQSVLAAAVSGKLTEEYANGNKTAREFSKLGDVGVKVRTGPFGSALHKSDYQIGGIPVINPMHINEGRIHPSEGMTISQDKFMELSAWQLKAGDVVVGRRGEMGRACVVDGKSKLLCGTGSMILEAPKNALSKYLEIILRSPTAIEYFNGASVGSTMVNLNQKVVKNLEVFFPGLNEQAQLVKQVETFFAHADTIEKQVQAAQARVNSLTQSILAKAFRGELTAEWRAANPELISGENSAEALLEKIRAEREVVKPKRNTKSRA